MKFFLRGFQAGKGTGETERRFPQRISALWRRRNVCIKRPYKMYVQTRTDNCGINFGALAPCGYTNNLSVSVLVVQGTWQARPTTSPELPSTALINLSVQNVRTLYRIRTGRSFRQERAAAVKEVEITGND